MSTKSKPKAKKHQGRFPLKTIRPTAFDLAALDVLTKKNNMAEAGVWRLGLARQVDFEGVRQEVLDKARQYA